MKKNINIVQEPVHETYQPAIQEQSMPQVEPQIQQVQEAPSYVAPTIEETVSDVEVTDFVQFEINKEELAQEQASQPQVETEAPESF